MRPSSFLFAFCALLSLTAVAPSQGPPVVKLQPSDLEIYDQFGWSGIVAGNWLMLGSVGDDDADPDAGAVYAYARTGSSWTLVQKVLALDGAVETGQDSFGFSVGVAGNLMAAGAPGDSNPAGLQAGSVFLFANEGGTWVQRQRIYSLDSDEFDFFGGTVALSEHVLAITARHDPGTGSKKLTVFVFEPQGDKWVQTAQLVTVGAPDNYPLAVSDDLIVVGIPSEGGGVFGGVGAVHSFEKVGGVWQETQRLDPSAPVESANFGHSLAMDGSRLIVGAPGQQDATGQPVGAAYMFERGPAGWTQVAMLAGYKGVSAVGGTNTWFGSAVALDGERAAAWAPFEDEGVASSGAVYDFALLSGSWTHVDHVVMPPEEGPGDMTSKLLSLSGHDLLGSIVTDDTFGELTGAAYVISLDDPITFLELGHALAGVDGAPQLSAAGTLLPGKLVTLQLTHGKPLTLGALVLGASQAFVPMAGGTLVPSPDAVISLPTDASGAGVLSGAWPVGVPSGAIVSLQWWAADAAGVKGFAASNGLGMLAP